MCQMIDKEYTTRRKRELKAKGVKRIKCWKQIVVESTGDRMHTPWVWAWVTPGWNKAKGMLEISDYEVSAGACHLYTKKEANCIPVYVCVKDIIKFGNIYSGGGKDVTVSKYFIYKQDYDERIERE